MVKKLVAAVMVLCLISIAGCTTTQKGAATGGVIGAGVGAIIGHQSGHETEGAVIGGAGGAAAGALIGEQAATKFCPTCGASYPGDVEYCPKDGTKLEMKK